MRTNKIKTTLFFFIVGFLFLNFANIVMAQEDYKVLAPLPCIGGDCKEYSETTKLEKYIPGVFRLAIGASAAFVLLNLVFGGFQYMSTDAFTKKEEGIKRIQNSIKGLFLVVGAWLILNTINPQLLNIDLKIDSAETPAVGGGGTVGPTDLRCSTGCVPLTSQFSIKPGAGSTVSSILLPKLVTLDSELERVGIPSWIITEAYPPTYTHQNSCHAYGTCIDVGAVPDAKVYNFISASTNAGVKSVFEVETQVRKDAVIAASCSSTDTACKSVLGERIAVYPPKDGKRQITGEHFSVYNQ